VLGANPGTEGVPGSPVLKPYTWVYCKPSVTVARWGVLAITGMEITPTSSAGGATASFEEMPVLTGGTPSATTTAWCVAVEPIESGKVGKVAVGGVVQCKVEVDKSDDKFVACSSGGLKTGVKGEGLILWKDSGTGSGKWALVRLGATATTELDVVTGVTLESGGIKITKETVYVIGKKDPKPADTTISTTACT
jgi:acyl dehydratase